MSKRSKLKHRAVREVEGVIAATSHDIANGEDRMTGADLVGRLEVYEYLREILRERRET